MTADATPARASRRPRLITAVAIAACLACVQCGGDSTPPTLPTPTPVPPNPGPPDTNPPTPTPPGPPSAPETFVGAGDIGMCGSPGMEQTARLLNNIGGTVYTTGDNAYFSGTKKEFDECYNPWWGGNIRSRTRPVPGNHEYVVSPGPYVDNFHLPFAQSTPPVSPNPSYYYSFRLGDWHAVALDSWLPSSEGTAQAVWLRADLAANRTKCTVVYFHFPLFTSGPNGNQTQMRPLWRILYEFDVDIVINGHDHLYERFAPQNPDGIPDPVRGIREFIVGTGGAMPYNFVTTMANSEKRIANTFGVLRFTLGDGRYQWDFVPVPGGTPDNGSDVCH